MIPKAWLLVAVLIFLLHAVYYWSWIEDDAFISFRYARNLVAGQGLVFNPGEKVEGYSNFAWVLAAAAALRVGVDPATMARILGLLGGVAGLVFSWRLARRLWPHGGGWNLTAPFFLALTPILPRHAVSGLETTCFAGLLAAACCLAAARPGAANRTVVVVLLLLLSLLRPEGVAFALIILVWRGWTRRDQAGSRWWLDGLIFLMAFGLYFVWRWIYFGLPFPNTFYFKLTGGRPAVIDGMHYSLDFLRESGGPAIVGLGLALLLADRRPRVLWLIIALVVVQTGVAVFAGGDWMHHYRFYAPVLPLLAAAMGAGAACLIAQAASGGRRWRLGQLILAVALAAVMVQVGKTERAVARLVMPAVQEEGYLYQSYRRVGLWLKNNTQPQAVVAVSDVGAVGYFSERRILDMFGLVDPHIARRPGRLHFKSDIQYVLAKQPEIIVLVAGGGATSEPTFLRLPDSRLFASERFGVEYELVHSEPIVFRGERVLIYRRR